MRSTVLSCVFPAIILITFGCAKSPTTSDSEGAAYEQLSKIGNAYIAFSGENGKAPESREELISFANGQVSDSDFLSKNDGEEFVFVWGTELNRRSSTPVVIGYEPAGKDGKRMVFTTRNW